MERTGRRGNGSAARVSGRARRVSSVPLEEWLVHDKPNACPYLAGQTARLPLRLPSRALTPREFARRLALGDRRHGFLLYRPNCGACTACEAIRIDVAAFEPSKTQRRVWRRGEEAFAVEIGAPVVTHERVHLYNRHKAERGLLTGDGTLDAAEYGHFLVDTCADSFEIAYRRDGQLVGVAVTDRAADSLSAVYCFFDPDHSRLSPGAYSILKQIQFCREWGLRYLYLGLYVRGCPAMAYKTGYLPHERLVGGRWRRFDRQT